MTRQQAHRLFERLRAQFAVHRPELGRLRLVLRKRHFLRRPAARDLAWYEIGDGTVNLMETALAGPAGRVEGLLAHELGHALDEDATRPYAERRADALAKKVLGVPVRYDDGDVQNLHHGVTPRPARLHENREPEMKRNPKKGYKMPETQARHTAEGLLARMKADGADTFAKKIKWVKKHMPNIDRPRTFVGWVTKGERGRVVLSRNPTPAYHRSRGDAELLLAEDSYRKAQALRRRGDASGSHDALIHAHRMAALAEADLLDGASPRAADAKRLAWWKAYSGLAADKRRNPRRSR